jgi:hypothetical protein
VYQKEPVSNKNHNEYSVLNKTQESKNDDKHSYVSIKDYINEKLIFSADIKILFDSLEFLFTLIENANIEFKKGGTDMALIKLAEAFETYKKL